MSGTFPSTPLPSNVGLQSKTQNFISVSQSGRRNVRQTGAHRWTMSISFSNMSRQEFMPVYAFLMDQDGQFETFDFVIPDLQTPRGTAGGTPLVNGASQVGKSIQTDGWNLSESVLLRGDIFKFTGHNKVYMCTQDVVSDGGGLATVNFAPALVESPVDDEALIVTGVPFKVMQSGTIHEYQVRPPLLYNFEVSFIETI